MKAWVWPLVFVTCSASAAETRFAFQTPYDRFELILNGNRGTVNGKAADLTSFAEVLPMLTKELGTETCAPGRSSISVKIGDSTRMIFPKTGIVSDGKTCLSAGGDGLHYFPVHRDFFIGPKKDSIKLKSPLKIFRNGVKVASLKRGQGRTWINETPDQLLNWDFIERLENSLNDFDIRLRVNESIKEGKPKMIIQSGDQAFEFYKLTNVMWAVKKPGMKWLVASDQWSFWYDFDQAVLEDRYAEQIRIAGDTSKDKESRLAALEKMDATWSPNMRDVYHKILNNTGEDGTIQGIAIKRLKRKPSIETAGEMIKFIESSTDDDLKREAGIVLKLQNPKGPKYNPSSSAEEKAKALEFWRNWWKQNSKSS